MGDAAAPPLAALAAASRRLQQLLLRRNDLTSAALPALRGALAANAALRLVDVSQVRPPPPLPCPSLLRCAACRGRHVSGRRFIPVYISGRFLRAFVWDCELLRAAAAGLRAYADSCRSVQIRSDLYRFVQISADHRRSLRVPADLCRSYVKRANFCASTLRRPTLQNNIFGGGPSGGDPRLVLLRPASEAPATAAEADRTHG